MNNYEITALTDTFILISDINNGPSVTNSAAEVVSNLNQEIVGGLNTRKIFYLDTDKRFDELRHNEGTFEGFSACSSSQQKFFQKILGE